ncbi:MAG: RNA polymerase sigma-54 factor [Ignavibacteriae bacterium]|nr:MAG: RNA polymerase sigma-54 factor [Ignavibacteriota bacterium]
MLSLHQKLSQQQKLSPQQIQYQKLLQLNTIALEQRIKTELELNPILEEVLEGDYELQDPSDNLSDDTNEDTVNNNDEFEVEDLMNEGDLDNDRLNKSSDTEDNRPIAPARISQTERLLDQLHISNLPEKLMILGEVIISSLSKDGYFREDLNQIVEDLKLLEHIEVSAEEAERVLKLIQTFEPVGIAARDLQECLLIQIKTSSYDPYYSYLAEKILSEHYKDFVNKRFEAIQTKMDLTKETLKSTLDLIHKLNPKPGGGSIDTEESNQITPDFLIEKVDDNYVITLNDKSLPSVTISKTYLEMLENKKSKRKVSKQEKATNQFLKEKFESAKWFIASIKQRRETLMKIMRTIFEKQFNFFENGTKFLKPMIYKDIADEIMMDISTISRVVNGKYVQSPMGIHELKYFFSEGLSTDTGNDISNKHIKILIKEICDSEPKNKPYSDEKLAKILVDKGIHIARRTVAKYREQMQIPVARLRKEL